jgi:hypothetical protein
MVMYSKKRALYANNAGSFTPFSSSDAIDMRIVSRQPFLRFPICEDCVPFELVVSASLL